MMDKYRNDISSTLGNLMAKRQQSYELREKSVARLNESSSNMYVLNAHKAAKSITDSSEAKLALLKNHMHMDANAAIKAFERFIQNKMHTEILAASSLIVEEYINRHKAEFNNIAIAATVQSFAK